MGETGDSSSSLSFFRRHWEGYKEFWSDRFSILDNYSKFIKGREEPLPSWSASDVEEFIASDPVHGPANDVIEEHHHILLHRVSVTATCFTGELSYSSMLPVLKTAREAVNYGLVGGLIGAVSTAGFAWKYSRSPHGAALSFGAGAVFGWTFGHEIANHYLQLYRLDTMGAQVKFLEWWQSKNKGRSS